MTQTYFVSPRFSINLCAIAAVALSACAAPTGEAPLQGSPLSQTQDSPSLELYEEDGTPRMRPVAIESSNGPQTEPGEPTEPVDSESEAEPEQVPPVWDGDFVATDDAQLEAFCQAGYTGVQGSVELTGAVMDVSALSCLEWVRADVSVTLAPGIARMDAFNDLVEVGGDIRVANLVGLELLVGFDSLAVLHGSFELEDNRSLREVSVGAALMEIGGGLSLVWNDKVEVSSTFPAAWRIGGDYIIERHGQMADLAEMPSLVFVEGNMQILDNPSYDGVEAMFGMERVGKDLVIDGNPALGNEEAADAGDVMADRVGGHVVLGRNGA